MWEFKRRINYYETDRMGVVHHSNYLRLLEEGRLAWLDANVMEYREMERQGIIIPVVSATGNFRNYLRYGDLCCIQIRLVEFTGVRIRFTYEVYNGETGELCYDGKTEHYCAHDGTYRPFSIRKKYPEIYQKICSLVEPLSESL